MAEEKKEVERTPYCPKLADPTTDSYPSCDGTYCAWFSPKLEMCCIRVAGESLAGIGVKFLGELKILTTTLISIENKVGDEVLRKYEEERKLEYHVGVRELVKRATAAYWFLRDTFPTKSGYIEPLKPAIEAVTGKELYRE